MSQMNILQFFSIQLNKVKTNEWISEQVIRTNNKGDKEYNYCD